MGPGPRVANLPLRVVLDTNVLVSALALRSRRLSQLPQYWFNGVIVPVASNATLGELTNTLRAPKFDLVPSDVRGLLGDYVPWCDIVEVVNPPGVPDCRDPKDRPFLELAAFAATDALVTGDLDLLDLQPFFNVPIMTPGELLASLQSLT